MILGIDAFTGWDMFANFLPPKLQAAYAAMRIGPIYPNAVLRMTGGVFQVSKVSLSEPIVACATKLLRKILAPLPSVYVARPTKLDPAVARVW